MNKIIFSTGGWDDYLYWQMQDKKTLKRINELLKDIQRTPFTGIATVEPLKHRNGQWSRRIDNQNRLVYSINSNKDIEVLSCRGHYDD